MSKTGLLWLLIYLAGFWEQQEVEVVEAEADLRLVLAGAAQRSRIEPVRDG